MIRHTQQFDYPPPKLNEEAGTGTGLILHRGAVRVKPLTGSLLTRDAGMIIDVTVWDLDTGETLSYETQVRGPHPDLESEYTLNCKLIAEALP